jgi:hypothetical protein
MSENKKLLVGLGAVLAVAIGLFAGLRFLPSSVGGMDHSGEAVPAPGQPLQSEQRTGRSADAVLVFRTAASAGLDEAVIEELAGLAGVAGADRYLFGTLPDGTPVVGLDPLDAPLRGAEGTLLSGRALVGRDFAAADPGTPTVLVGVEWAESHESIYGYQVAGMIGDHPAPVLLDGAEVTVLDVVATDDDQADRSVFVPLSLGRQLLEQPNGLSLLALRLEAGADATAIRQAAASAGLQAVEGET